MVADLAVPFISRRFNPLLPPDAPHMTERYGLFTIIVAGEAFVKVISSAPSTPLAVQELLLGGLGLVIAGCLWWLYFDDVAGSLLKAGAHTPFIWLYAHLPVAIGLTAFGVGVKKVVFLHGGDALPEKYRLLLGGALALYLIFVLMIDLVTIRTGKASSPRTRAAWRLGAAGAIALVAVFGAGLTPPVFMLALAAACVAPIVVDLIRAQPATEPPHGQHASG
jgi:low temperature requirement protein LtrA